MQALYGLGGRYVQQGADSREDEWLAVRKHCATGPGGEAALRHGPGR